LGAKDKAIADLSQQAKEANSLLAACDREKMLLTAEMHTIREKLQTTQE
jgi:hypothetical protein